MITINEQIVKLLIKMRLKNRADLLSAKKSLIRQFKVSPVSHADLLTAYRLLLRKKQIKQNRLLEKLLIKRPIRSLSGVAIIAVLTKPYFCKSWILNSGMGRGDSDLVMVVDNDCVLDKDILENIEEHMGDNDYFVPYTDINFLNEGHTRQLVRNGKFGVNIPLISKYSEDIIGVVLEEKI